MKKIFIIRILMICFSSVCLGANISYAQSKQTTELLNALKSKDTKIIFRATQDAHNIISPDNQDLFVEPLMNIVKRDAFRKNYIREWAVNWLVFFKDIRSEELLIALVKDENPRIRVAATRGLGWIKDNRTLELLTELLNDPETEVRVVAAETLGAMKSKRAIALLIANLKKDTDPEVKATVAEILGESGDPRAIEALITILNNLDLNDYTQRGVMLVTEKALVKIGEPAVTPLIDALNNGDMHSRRIIFLLSDIGAPAVEALLDLLKREDTSLYNYIELIQALGRIKDERVIAPLVNIVLHDKNNSLLAAQSLRELGNVRGIELLINAFSSEDKSICIRVEDALVWMPSIATEPLISALKNVDGKVKVYVLFALFRIDKERCREIVSSMAGDVDLKDIAAGGFLEIFDEGYRGKEWTLIYSLIAEGTFALADECYKKNSLLKLAAERWAYACGHVFYPIYNHL